MPKVVSDERILEATLDTILTYGYDGATTRLIAAAANVNEVTLFRKFGSKTNMVLLAVNQELSAFRESHIAYTGNLQADLERIVQFYATLFAKRAKFIPLIISELPRRADLRAGMQQLDVVVHSLTTIIAQYQASGQLRREPPLQTLIALLSPVLTISVVHTLNDQLELPIDSSAHVHAFLQGRSPL